MLIIGRLLGTLESSVEAAGNGTIGSAFDDGTAIGKQRDFEPVPPKFQDEIGISNFAMRLQPDLHLAK